MVSVSEVKADLPEARSRGSLAWEEQRYDAAKS